MKPAPFQLHQVHSRKEALSLLEKYKDDAKVLAGGQTLVSVLAMRVASPDHLIDINKVEEFKTIEVQNDLLRIGPCVRQAQLENWVELYKTQPLLSMMFPWVSHTAIRNRGTVCGSIAHADPSSELVLALAVLRGTVELSNKKAIRKIRATEFFIGALQTDRKSNELISAVNFPISRKGEGYGFAEYGYRHGDFAVVAVAVVKRGGHWRIGFGGIDDVPIVVEVNTASTSKAIEFLEKISSDIEVREDPTATSGLRRHLMRTLGKRACMQAEEFKGIS